MIVLKHNASKTVRLESVVENMRRLDEVEDRQHFLIKRYYAEQFRAKHMKNLRSAQI